MAKKFEDKGKKEKKKEEDKKKGKKKMRKLNKDPNRAYLIKKLLNAGTSTAEIMKNRKLLKTIGFKIQKI